jgi:hypothetical protein
MVTPQGLVVTLVPKVTLREMIVFNTLRFACRRNCLKSRKTQLFYSRFPLTNCTGPSPARPIGIVSCRLSREGSFSEV